MPLSSPILEALPDEMLIRLFTFFAPLDMLRSQRVCRHFFQLIRSNFHKMRRFNDAQVEISFDEKSSVVLKPSDTVTLEAPIFGPSFLSFSNFTPRNYLFSLRYPEHYEEAIELDEVLANFSQETNINWKRLPSPMLTISVIGQRRFAIRSVLPFNEAFYNLVHTLTRRFLFTEVDIRHVEDIRFESIINSFTLLPELSSATIQFSHVTQEQLTLALESTNVRSLCFSGVHPNSPQLFLWFFNTKFARRLTTLTRDSMQGLNSLDWDLDNSSLLEMRDLETILLPSVRTSVTARGIRDVLEEWKLGERKLKNLILEIRKNGMSRDKVLAMLHRCEGCTDKDHPLLRFDGQDRLHIAVYNDQENWIVDVRQCTGRECSRCY